jgi:hypothetical protein
MSVTHRKKEERLESADACYTPPGLARACVDRLIVDGWVRNPETMRVLEPTCGEMAWVKALLGKGFARDHLVANDTNPIPGWTVNPEFTGIDLHSRDFLRAGFHGFDLVVGNPPYNDTMAHLEVSLEALTSTGVLAYLLPIGWFTAQGGKDRTRQAWLNAEGKPAHVYLVTPRPKFREGTGTDSAAYAMVVWATGARRGAGFDIIDWFDAREMDDEEARPAKEAARLVAKAAKKAKLEALRLGLVAP